MATDFISHLNWFSLLNISTFGNISTLVCGTRLWGARALRCTFHSTSINWRSNLFLRLLKFYDNFPHRFISRTIRSAECVEWMRERREKVKNESDRQTHTSIDLLWFCNDANERQSEKGFIFFSSLFVVRNQKAQSAHADQIAHTHIRYTLNVSVMFCRTSEKING